MRPGFGGCAHPCGRRALGILGAVKRGVGAPHQLSPKVHEFQTTFTNTNSGCFFGRSLAHAGVQLECKRAWKVGEMSAPGRLGAALGGLAQCAWMSGRTFRAHQGFGEKSTECHAILKKKGIRVLNTNIQDSGDAFG